MEVKVKKKKEYSKPDFTVIGIRVEQSLLTMSGQGVRLQGAGVDESDAEEKGTNIWNN